MKKDIKKSSYYVWFLGAEEAKGLRGSEYMIPVIRNLVEREKQIEPFKVTLQVSHKGLKIIQNVPLPAANTANSNGSSNNNLKASTKTSSIAASGGKTEVIKHFIPHHAVTSVFQLDDIVSCILLLYNPVTKCPVHVHAYRCDSVETAEILCGQLQILLERPENQKKLEDIESRLRAKGLIAPPSSAVVNSHSATRNARTQQQESSPSDCGRSSARESELSAGSSGGSDRCNESRITNLYDSLAAELKEKLNVASKQKQAPLLLPPRDYDTVHRQKGNLSGIDFRRCLNMNIVGMNVAAKDKKHNNNNKSSSSSDRIVADNHNSRQPTASGSAMGGKYHHPMMMMMANNNNAITASAVVGAGLDRGPRKKLGSSGGSSGIGSDHAPSPKQECETNRFLDNQSSSDEEWNTEQAANGGNSSLFLVQTSTSHHPTTDWKSKELSLPRARRHNSSGFESSSIPSPGSPKILPSDQQLIIGSGVFYGGRDEDKYQDTTPLYKAKKSSPSNSSDKQKLLLDEIRVRKQKLPLDDQESLNNNNNLKKRTPEGRQRSPSPGEIVSPKERFKDAKEKFLLLEKERLEEQEKLIQLNMEKKKMLLNNHHENSSYAEGVASGGGGRQGRQQIKSKSNRSSDRFEDDLFEDHRVRYHHHHYQQDDHNNNRTAAEVDAELKRRSLAKANYHRNRSMESLNSEDYPSLASSSCNYNNNNSSNAYRNSENVSGGLSRSSRMNSFPEEEFETKESIPYNNSRMSRYHSSEIDQSSNRRRFANNDSPISHPLAAASHPSSGRPATRSFSEDYLPDHSAAVATTAAAAANTTTNSSSNNGAGSRYRDSTSHHLQSVPFAEDTSIPLQRYRSPTRSSSRPAYGYHHPQVVAVGAEEDVNNVRRSGAVVKRSDSRYHNNNNTNNNTNTNNTNPHHHVGSSAELRRTALETAEDEKRRHSNEIAKELKRRSYQDHRSTTSGVANELSSYPSSAGAASLGGYHHHHHRYHHGAVEDVATDQDRYPSDLMAASSSSSPHGRSYHHQQQQHYNNSKGMVLMRNGRCSPTNINTNTASNNSAAASNSVSVSPRYRHSYAEPFHHHAAAAASAATVSHNHDLLHRTNSSLSSGRIGIAAVHHY